MFDGTRGIWSRIVTLPAGISEVREFGQMDRPDFEGRKAILAVHARGKPIAEASFSFSGFAAGSVNGKSNQFGIELFSGRSDFLILQSTHKGRRKIVGQSSCPAYCILIDH